MQVALITGADRGLGLALTAELLERGWTVVAGQYMDWPVLGELAAKFATTLHIVPLDVSKDESVKAAAGRATEVVSHVDLLISNAAIFLSAEVESIRDAPSYDGIIDEFNVNAVGSLRVMDAFLPLLDKGELKRLCFVSSEAGSIAASTRTGWFGYCMSKCALNIAVKNLSNDLIPQGYSFRLYYPGWMRTYMRGTLDTAAQLEPEEGAELALNYFLDPVNAEALTLHAFDGTDFPW
jgi:NAD(P)-dependent dehydrogenase (short-subunit alcohol dehydrogenase family)